MSQEQINAEEVEVLEKNPDPTWKEFLETYPIGTVQNVRSIYRDRKPNASVVYRYRLAPILRLRCEACSGERNFTGQWRHDDRFRSPERHEDFLTYTCKDCEKWKKTYCLAVCYTDENGNGQALKLAEYPETNFEITPSLRQLLGDHYWMFKKGLVCENRGLGIGAFAYYRRVVENQKDNLIEAIIKVAQKLDAPAETILELQSAATETQFKTAVGKIKSAIPESIRVKGHNPLTLLHAALSVGLHAADDNTCLRRAHSIRLVLAEFSERLELALREQTELQAAVSEILNKNVALATVPPKQNAGPKEPARNKDGTT